MVHEAHKEAASVGVGVYWSWANLFCARFVGIVWVGLWGMSERPTPLGAALLLERVSMQDIGYELPRTPLLGTSVNKPRIQYVRCRFEQEAYQDVYRGERPAHQESDPKEAFAAMLSEPDLTYPQQDRSEAEHQATHAPRPEDQRQDRAPYEQDRGRQPQNSRSWWVSPSHYVLSEGG